MLFSFVKTESVLADRLLLGVDFIGYAYVNNVDSASDEGGVQWIKQCKPDQEKTPKTGDYVTDECGDEGAEDAFGTEGIYPNFSLEINFGKPSTGWGLMLVLKPTNKNRTKLVNYVDWHNFPHQPSLTSLHRTCSYFFYSLFPLKN